jgi:hypothetical protein
MFHNLYVTTANKVALRMREIFGSCLMKKINLILRGIFLGIKHHVRSAVVDGLIQLYIIGLLIAPMPLAFSMAMPIVHTTSLDNITNFLKKLVFQINK